MATERKLFLGNIKYIHDILVLWSKCYLSFFAKKFSKVVLSKLDSEKIFGSSSKIELHFQLKKGGKHDTKYYIIQHTNDIII